MRLGYLVDGVSAHYELSYRLDEHALLVRVHPIAWKGFEREDLMTTPIVSHYTKLLQAAFVPPVSNGRWGFENVFTTEISSVDGWYEVKAKLRRIKDNNHNDQMALRASLDLLFTVLAIGIGDKVDTSCSIPQLITVSCMYVEVGMNGGSLSVEVSDKVAEWLHKQPHEKHCEVIIETMKDAYFYMWPGERKYSRFGALCRETGLIYLDVPDNACDLSPDIYCDRKIIEGYRLVPHNVDSGLQQLSILAGVFTLSELVRNDLK
jgi:hypothetical protein